MYSLTLTGFQTLSLHQTRESKPQKDNSCSYRLYRALTCVSLELIFRMIFGTVTPSLVIHRASCSTSSTTGSRFTKTSWEQDSSSQISSNKIQNIQNKRISLLNPIQIDIVLYCKYMSHNLTTTFSLSHVQIYANHLKKAILHHKNTRCP